MSVCLTLMLSSCSGSGSSKLVLSDSSSSSTPTDEVTGEDFSTRTQYYQKQGEEWVNLLQDPHLKYDGGDIVMRYEAMATSSIHETVNGVTMVLVDGKRIPFSLDGSAPSEVFYHSYDDQKKIFELRFQLDQVGLKEDSLLTVVTLWGYDITDGIPQTVVDAYEHVSSPNYVYIESSVPLDNQSNRDDEVCTNMERYTKPSNSYACITATPESINNFCVTSLQDTPIYFHSGALGVGSFTAMVLLDGKPVNAFDGKPYLEWENTDDNKNPVLKELDPEILPASGKHYLSTIVINKSKVGDNEVVTCSMSQYLYLDLEN